MKIKLTQRLLIQIAAIVFLVWIVVHSIQRSDFDSLIIGGFVGAVFIAQWIIPKKFPELDARQRFFGKLVWLSICLALFFVILGFADFNVSTSGWFVPVITSIACFLIFSHFHRQDLSRQLAEKQKNDAKPI